MTRNQLLNTLGPLFEAADQGLIELPTATVKARQASAHLAGQLATIVVPAEARDQLFRAVMDSAVAGQPLPTGDVVVEAENAIRAADSLRVAARDALETLDNQLAATITPNARSFIVDVLRPVHTSIVADLRTCLKIVGPELDKTKLLNATEKVRSARTRLDAVVAQYGLIRRCWVPLAVHDPSTLDSSHKFVEFSNGEKAPWRNITSTNATTPWPSDAVGRIAWFIANDFEPWLPTGDDRDEQMVRAYPDSPIVKGHHENQHLDKAKGTVLQRDLDAASR
jgi:hypothetical protein